MIDDNSDGDVGTDLSNLAAELSRAAKQPQFDVPELAPPQLGEHTHPTAVELQRESLNPLIMDIPVTMKVVLGTARMPVASVSKLARGSVLKLDNRVGDPVDVLVNGRLLARGEVVVLDEGQSRFGVKLTEIGGVKDKAR